MKWIGYILIAAAIVYVVYDYFAERKRIKESAARARQAKADKKIFSKLNFKDDGTIFNPPPTVNAEGN